MRHVLTTLATVALLTSLSGQGRAQPARVGPAAERQIEDEIAEGLNAYRSRLGLPPVARSRALDRVARAHVIDLVTNGPDRGVDSRGMACNSHSWSSQGNWRPVCYTADHAHASGMWDKPREISGGAYAGNGYEIAMWSSGGAVTAATAVAGWQASDAHNAVIAERSVWANARWQAMGVGVHGGYAVVWFGKEPDTTRD